MAGRRAQAKKPARTGKPGQRTLEGWRANTIDLKLGVEDLDLLDTVTAPCRTRGFRSRMKASC